MSTKYEWIGFSAAFESGLNPEKLHEDGKMFITLEDISVRETFMLELWEWIKENPNKIKMSSDFSPDRAIAQWQNFTNTQRLRESAFVTIRAISFQDPEDAAYFLLRFCG